LAHIDNITSDLGKSQAALARAEAKVARLEIQLRQANHALDDARDSNIVLSKTLEEGKSTLRSLRTEADACAKRADALVADVRRFRIAACAKDSEITALRTQLNEHGESAERARIQHDHAMEAVATEWKRAIAELTVHDQAQTTEIRDLRNALTTARERLDTQVDRSNALQTLAIQLEEQLRLRDEGVTQLQQMSAARELRLRETLLMREEEVRSLKRQLATAQQAGRRTGAWADAQMLQREGRSEAVRICEKRIAQLTKDLKSSVVAEARATKEAASLREKCSWWKARSEERNRALRDAHERLAISDPHLHPLRESSQGAAEHTNSQMKVSPTEGRRSEEGAPSRMPTQIERVSCDPHQRMLHHPHLSPGKLSGSHAPEKGQNCKRRSRLCSEGSEVEENFCLDEPWDDAENLEDPVSLPPEHRGDLGGSDDPSQFARAPKPHSQKPDAPKQPRPLLRPSTLRARSPAVTPRSRDAAEAAARWYADGKLAEASLGAPPPAWHDAVEEDALLELVDAKGLDTETFGAYTAVDSVNDSLSLIQESTTDFAADPAARYR
jgi:hypothetical protein